MTFLPIVERELRVAARKPATYQLRFFTALGVMLILFAVFLGGQVGAYQAQGGQPLFHLMSTGTMAFSLLAGVFLTADCLSSERREGTLGLLFLTDLQGYDVVLGKLVANSLPCMYGLLAVLPVTALVVLLGGVTAGDVVRMAALVLATLLFSLSAGVLVSALCREARQAIVGTVMLVALVTFVLPACHKVAMERFPSLARSRGFWPSPLFAYTEALAHGFTRHPHDFWFSVGAIILVSGGFLIFAGLILPHMWQEGRGTAAQDQEAARLAAASFGAAGQRRQWRTKLLERNPFHWLARRNRLPQLSSTILFGALGTLWVLLFICIFIAPRPTNLEAFDAVIFMAFGLHAMLKIMVGVEASRRLSEDRQSGALEVLLVTPLPEREIIAGQRRALLQHFLFPLLGLLAMNGALIWLVVWPDPTGTHRSAGFNYTQRFFVSFLGGMAVLLLDFVALGWVGIRMALTARNHNRAVLLACAQVLLGPWLVYLLVVLTGAAGRGAGWFSGPRGTINFLVCWFVLSGINDLVMAGWAKRQLTGGFRSLAVEPGTRERPHATGEV